MNVTTEIKKKEDSLTALMDRILKEPIEPLRKSINASMETLLDTKDKLDDIESSISVNVNSVEDMSKSLRRALNDIKDEVLPDHALSIQRQFKTLSEASSKKIHDSIDAQQQSIDNLKTTLKTTHDTILGEISANQELSQHAIAELTQLKDEVLPDHTLSIQKQFKTLSEVSSKKLHDSIDAQQQSIDNLKTTLKTTHDTILGEISTNKELNQHSIAGFTQQCLASNQTLAASLQNATNFIEKAIITQQRTLEANHQALLDQMSSAANDRNAIQQSLTRLASQHEVSGKSLVIMNDSLNAVYIRLADIQQASASGMESHQTAMTRMLTEQNSAFAANIAVAKAKFKVLTITTAVLFVLNLGYLGYSIWSKVN